MAKILIVDDEATARESLRMILEGEHQLLFAASGREALRILKKEECDLVLLDILMPGMDGFEVLKGVKELAPHLPIVMITALDTAKAAVEAMRSGAYHYITKPFDVKEIRSLVKEILAEKEGVSGPPQIIGETQRMKEVLEMIRRVSQSDAPVLLLGESGTGKELMARAIHYQSPRREGPFVVMNCAAIPENLIESELFGHEKGAFTDAKEGRRGKFELAHRGTLFMDEIADLSLSTQAKILRFLQFKELERVGGGKTIRVDVRFIAATNKDLRKEVREGRFREDLYYRINVIPVYIPPLRERREDIPLLVDHFIRRFSERERRSIKGITPQALRRLMDYPWPGNVRELENVIERMVTLCRGEFLREDDLPEELSLKGELPSEGNLPQREEELERRMILDALKKANFVQTKAAKILGISRRVLKYKMDKLGIKP